MENILNLLQDDRWSYPTLFLYILIVGSSTYFAWISQTNYQGRWFNYINKGKVYSFVSEFVPSSISERFKKIFIAVKNSKIIRNSFVKNDVKINYFYLAISFFILWFFSAFRSIGADYDQYTEIFRKIHNEKYIEWTGIEPTYVLLNKIIRFFTDSDVIFIATISFVTTLLVYSTIVYFSNKIHVGIAVLAYTTMFYFQSYNLTRIYLASAIILFASRYLIENKYVKFIVLSLIAMSLHTSSIVIFLPFLLFLVFKRNKFIVFMLLTIFVILVLFFLEYLIIFNVSDRYTQYLVNTNLGSIGIGQFAFHSPLIILFFYVYKYKFEKRLMHIFYVFIFSSLAVGMLGYGIPMTGRLLIHFTYPYILFLPYVIKQINPKVKEYKFILGFVILYLIGQLLMYLSGYIYSDAIMPYTNIFNWHF